MSSAEVEVEGYARVKNARLRVKKLPVFYWPYMIWPAKTERTSGLLVPNVGYSQRRGEYLGLAWYQVLGPSYDNTVYVDGYTEGFYGVGDEFRYRPSESTRGNARRLLLPQRRARRRRPALRLGPCRRRPAVRHARRGRHRALLRLRGLPRLRAQREPEHPALHLLERLRLRQLGRAFAEHPRRPARDLPRRQRRDHRSRASCPRSPTSCASASSGRARSTCRSAPPPTTSQSKREGSYDAGYGRFDLQPEVKLPLRPAPWLSVAVAAGGRATWWGDSFSTYEVDPETGVGQQRCDGEAVASDQLYCGETLTRVYPTANVEMVGPSFSRIFETGGKSFAKFKHVIEPRWSYGFLGAFDEQNQVAQFDEIDLLNPSNIAEVALVNRLLAQAGGRHPGRGVRDPLLRARAGLLVRRGAAAAALARRRGHRPVERRSSPSCASIRAGPSACRRRRPTTPSSTASTRPRSPARRSCRAAASGSPGSPATPPRATTIPGARTRSPTRSGSLRRRHPAASGCGSTGRSTTTSRTATSSSSATS